MPCVRLSRSPAVVLALLSCVAVAGCSADRANSAAVGAEPPTVAGGGAYPSQAVNADPNTAGDRQLMMMDDITAAFENGAVVPQYAFIRDQHDGCGYTAGWIGFCTADGDLLDVVRAYGKAASGNPLSRYLPTLRRLATAKTVDVGPLGGGFPADWRRAAQDPVFRRLQLTVGHASYLTPARAIARREGVRTALGLEFLFDTALMMGPGPTDCDGVVALTAETDRAMHGSPATGVPETEWLRRYTAVRIQHLRRPCTPGRQADWPRAVGRAQALQGIADAGGWRLDPPIQLRGDYQLTISQATD